MIPIVLSHRYLSDFVEPLPDMSGHVHVAAAILPSLAKGTNADGKREEIHERRNMHHQGIVLKLVAFEVAVESALARVLVLDSHFDEIGVNVLGPALSRCQVLDARLLTSRSDIDNQDRERRRKTLVRHLNSNRSGPGGVEVQWRAKLDKHSFPFLRDRFAIVDDDLWHFGSTVGGGHPGLTAASGPWSASDTRAVEFFDECWRICNA